MEKNTAVTIRYWVASDHASEILANIERIPNGMQEFRNELEESYVSVIHGHPAGAGGGLDLFVDFVTSISLHDVALAIVLGAAYDLVKTALKVFALRPFLSALKKLRETSREDIGIAEFRIVFSDTILHIDNVCYNALPANLEKIFLELARKYDSLKLSSGFYPTEIFIPVIEDPILKPPTTFRRVSRFEYDEGSNLEIGPDRYFEFLGLQYDLIDHLDELRVFDVKKSQLLKANFKKDGFWLLP